MADEDDDFDNDGEFHKFEPFVVPKPNTTLEAEVVNSFGLKRFALLPLIGEQNQVISPIDLFSALSILYIGSNGETALELRELLELKNFNISDEQMFKGIQCIYREFIFERIKMSVDYQLFKWNKIFVQKETNISNKFKVWTKRYFNIDIEKFDFKKDGNLIESQINNEIKKAFEERTDSIFPKTFTDETKLVLVSALYFKGKWLIKFETNETKEISFFNDGITEIKVKMMSITNRIFRFTYCMEMNANIVEIPLISGELTFILVLPKRINGLKKLKKELNFQNLKQKINALQVSKCDIFLPKFKIEFNYDFGTDFRNQLKVFKTEAEMKEIDKNQNIRANSILQKVVFEIDESGEIESKPIEKEKHKFAHNRLVLMADHPFLFIVKDTRSEAFLFVGQFCRFSDNLIK